MSNNGAVNKTLDATTGNQSYTIPAGYHNGNGKVTVVLEEKTATPATTSQSITPTAGKVLSKVTVNAIPKQYGDATVTVCHSHSKNLKEECREADIIIAAIGKPDLVTADMVKPGAVVIDVGTTRVPDATRKSGFRLNGDVKFDEVAEKCSFITPVPGGVGPMTICSLMKNTLAAGKKEIYD